MNKIFVFSYLAISGSIAIVTTIIQDIEIFDIIGRCILTTQNESVDFSKYSSGRYCIKVQFTDQSKQVKLFIKE